LLADGTHEIWAGLSMKEKCRFFQIRFPGKLIAPVTMERFFKEHRVRNKVVKVVKYTPPADKHKVEEQKQAALANLKAARELQLEVVYQDEIVFSKRSILLKAHGNVKTHMAVQDRDLYVGYRAVIAAVSAEQGFIYYEKDDKAVTSESYWAYLRNLRVQMGDQPFALYMDQLQIHKTKAALKLYDELEILPIFNVSYMPELNPIESCFSHVKRIFSRERLWHLVNNISFDIDEEISDAFDVITPELVKKCA
jgi:transposase